MWYLRKNDTNELAYKTKRLTDLKNELMVVGGWEKGRGKRIIREFGMGMYTLLYLKWISSKDVLCPMRIHNVLCPMLPGSLAGRGVSGRRDTCICAAECLCCPLKLSQLC